MNVARSAGEVLAEHTTLELECIDRMYLNVYVPLLQTAAGTAWFFREVRGNPVPSSALMAPMTNRFVAGLKRFAADSGRRGPVAEHVRPVITALASLVRVRRNVSPPSTTPNRQILTSPPLTGDEGCSGPPNG